MTSSIFANGNPSSRSVCNGLIYLFVSLLREKLHPVSPKTNNGRKFNKFSHEKYEKICWTWYWKSIVKMCYMFSSYFHSDFPLYSLFDFCSSRKSKTLWFFIEFSFLSIFLECDLSLGFIVLWLRQGEWNYTRFCNDFDAIKILGESETLEIEDDNGRNSNF